MPESLAGGYATLFNYRDMAIGREQITVSAALARLRTMFII